MRWLRTRRPQVRILPGAPSNQILTHGRSGYFDLLVFTQAVPVRSGMDSNHELDKIPRLKVGIAGPITSALWTGDGLPATLPGAVNVNSPLSLICSHILKTRALQNVKRPVN